MTLGKWHHRSSGEWRVWKSQFVDWQWWIVKVRGYQWSADSNARVEVAHSSWAGPVMVSPWEDGVAPFAWLARRRALAALKRLEGEGHGVHLSTLR